MFLSAFVNLSEIKSRDYIGTRVDFADNQRLDSTIGKRVEKGGDKRGIRIIRGL